MLDDFKKFAMKGNVVDLAVAVIIGGAFGKIVNSFVNDVLMPPLGALLGGVDFTGLSWQLSGEATLNYGMFIQTVIDFLIVAWAIFLAIKAMERFKKKEEEKPSEPPKEEVLLTEIRDLLKKG